MCLSGQTCVVVIPLSEAINPSQCQEKCKTCLTVRRTWFSTGLYSPNIQFIRQNTLRRTFFEPAVDILKGLLGNSKKDKPCEFNLSPQSSLMCWKHGRGVYFESSSFMLSIRKLGLP